MIEYIFLIIIVGIFLVLINYVIMKSLLNELENQQSRMVKQFTDYMESQQNARTETKD